MGYDEYDLSLSARFRDRQGNDYADRNLDGKRRHVEASDGEIVIVGNLMPRP